MQVTRADDRAGDRAGDLVTGVDPPHATTLTDMVDEAVGKAVQAALTPLVASLAAWGVGEAHWLPDRQGAPVIWLRTRTTRQADALSSQVWLEPQVQVTLTRLGVPHDLVWRIRIEVTSAQAEDQLFRD